MAGLPLAALLPVLDPKSSSSPAAGHCTSPQQQHRFHRLMQDFLQFVFETLLVDLIRGNFYVTESAALRLRPLFYRHDTWHRLTAPSLAALIQSNLQAADPSRSAAALRLLPKENGKFRPIVAFKRLPSTEEGNRLRASFDVLKLAFEQAAQDSSSIIGMDQIQERLLRYKKQHTGPLYMAKVDIANCFDSIPQDRLLHVLHRLLHPGTFLVKRVDTVQTDLISGRPSRRITRLAYNLNAAGDCDELRVPRHAIAVDRVAGRLHDGADLLAVISEHLAHSTVCIDGKYYKQRHGIPQGSFLSTLLCGLFYAQFDREHLAGLTGHPGTLVLRYVDDFLFIAPDYRVINQLLDAVSASTTTYNITLSHDKTRTNFHRATGEFLPDAKFAWCGLLLDRGSMDVSADYANFHDTCTQPTWLTHL